MQELVQQLILAMQAGRAVVYCRLVETRGSTPQKAGACMLVYATGEQFGTLGGGCVEAEVKRRALAAADRGQPEIATFKLDSDYGWDDGLICGGKMQVLICPLSGAAAKNYFATQARLIASGQGCTEVIAFDAEKSGLPVPVMYLMDGQGEQAASLVVPGAPAELPTSLGQQVLPLHQRPRPHAAAGVAFLPSLGRCRLVIVGAGHVGQAVAAWASDLDFDVWVVDDRAEYANVDRFPKAEKLVLGDIGQVLPELEITPDTYCLVVTRGHQHDEQALFHLCNRGARYVGMIGSKRKIRMILDDLESEGIPPEVLAAVYAPVGIPIGSQTVPEIAISILAELVSHRNLGGQVPCRPLLQESPAE